MPFLTHMSYIGHMPHIAHMPLIAHMSQTAHMSHMPHTTYVTHVACSMCVTVDTHAERNNYVTLSRDTLFFIRRQIIMSDACISCLTVLAKSDEISLDTKILKIACL